MRDRLHTPSEIIMEYKEFLLLNLMDISSKVSWLVHYFMLSWICKFWNFENGFIEKMLILRICVEK